MALQKPLKQVTGQIQQFSDGDTMSTQTPLIIQNGQIQQLPAGDTLAATTTTTFFIDGDIAKTVSPTITVQTSVS